MAARVWFDIATGSFAKGFLHDFGIDECCKSLKDLALKETPVTIVLRGGVELKLTTRKTVETVKSRRAARGHSSEDAVLSPTDSIVATKV